MKSIRHNFTVAAYGFYNSIWYNRANSMTPERTTSTLEIDFITADADGESMVNERGFSQKSGRVILAPKGSNRHSRIGRQPYQCYYLHLSELDEQLKERISAFPTSFFIQNTDYYFGAFQNLLRYDNDIFEDRMMINAGIMEIIAHLLQENPEVGEDKLPAFIAHANDLQKARKYIDKHYAEDISVEMLAEMANLSASHFYRLFMEAFRVSPGKHLQSVRLSAAKVLLITTTIPISEVAARTGFASQHYLTARFKAAYQCTPLNYRHMMTKPENE